MEDCQILELYWSRDERAIDETARQYGSRCHAVAMNILANREDAEECVNDTWLRAWNAIPPQRPGKLGAFLSRVTRNIAFDRFRRATAAKRGGGETHAVLEELSECVSGEDTEDAVITRELGGAVNAFLRSLNGRDRDVFLRRYFFVEPTDAIAGDMGLSGDNVRMILSRTRKKLRQYLETEGYL